MSQEAAIILGSLVGVVFGLLASIPVTNWQWRRFYRQQFGREPPKGF